MEEAPASSRVGLVWIGDHISGLWPTPSQQHPVQLTCPPPHVYGQGLTIVCEKPQEGVEEVGGDVMYPGTVW